MAFSASFAVVHAVTVQARFECRKLVLVGDPKQLSPTIQGSEPDHEAGLEQTLFDRLMKMGYEPTMLRTQYRCHPAISAISNRLFYENKLLDGVTAEDRTQILPCGVSTYGLFIIVLLISTLFVVQAKFVVFLIECLLESGVDPAQIGVITLYKSQLQTISTNLTASRATSHAELKAIQISTVDAFQGGEKDLIILSCVRTDHIGFIDCDRRTNVALTRAKRFVLLSFSLSSCLVVSLTVRVNIINLDLFCCSVCYHWCLLFAMISTVDAFQGGEKDLIILSCVRTDHIGFIDCDRRTNVALTRAKRHLLIVGNLKMLSCNTVWGKVIEHCQSKMFSLLVKTSIRLQEREMAINVKDKLLTAVYNCPKRHFSHRFCYIPHSKGFPDGLCHSQDFMKKWTQENNDINEGPDSKAFYLNPDTAACPSQKANGKEQTLAPSIPKYPCGPSMNEITANGERRCTKDDSQVSAPRGTTQPLSFHLPCTDILDLDSTLQDDTDDELPTFDVFSSLGIEPV
ncbi:uncharacterized protein LOC110060547 [Orbicella faveolata]|uniref:uncharacterized protein LOC110060547 n=1 Tax=Orbicella faveolata TaxID=48498 RepID=UPI0009E49D5A|nr:uncharacterized protein LOC110060547 [Orbicella faveolata]